MTVFNSSLERRTAPQAQQRRDAMLARIAQLRALEDRAAQASAKSKPVFDKRGQLLPRERVALLLDPGAPWLPLCSLAGFLQDTRPGQVGARRRHRRGHRLHQRRALHGGGQRLGHRGRRHPAHGPGEDPARAGDGAAEQAALCAPGGERRRQPHEVPVEGFVHGGSLFRNLARLSAAGLPVITVQHGSGTAGGAYMPGFERRGHHGARAARAPSWPARRC
jgi:geranyl-CoA carboxylase beta subunit